jgi:glycosyltransferase involved in cell wall biosynthesis
VRISAVIPAFNREATVGRSIESALAQSRPPAEILVVDDGSTDGTAAAVAAYADAVHYVYQPNAGASAARNHGVGLSRSPWVAFLDSDDHWTGDHLERMAAVIDVTGGSAGFYFADTMWATAEGHVSLWEMSGFARPDGPALFADATAPVMQAMQPTMLQSSVFHRDTFLAAGGLWPALRTRHDTHLFLVLGIGQPAVAVPHFGVRMTTDDQSGGRLTEAFGPSTRDWWVQTQCMYADVLHRFPSLPGNHRRDLGNRLATAHLRLGQDDWQSRHLGRSARHLMEAVRIAPGHLASRAVGKMRRRWTGDAGQDLRSLPATAASLAELG